MGKWDSNGGPQARSAVTVRSVKTSAGRKLVIEGTAGDDEVVITQKAGKVIISTPLGSQSHDAKLIAIAVYGFGGNDVLRVAQSVTIPVWVFGGDGSDSVFAIASARQNLYGQGGDDLLVSFNGASDFVSGGAGRDSFWTDGVDGVFDASEGEIRVVDNPLAGHQMRTGMEQVRLDGIAAFEQYIGQYQDRYYTSPDGATLAWHESRVLAAYVAMYEATGDVQYLQAVVKHADVIFANRADYLGVVDTVRQKLMPAWTSTLYTDGQPYAWLVHAAMVTYPIARFVYLTRAVPELRAQFAQKADAYETQIRQVIAGFDADWRQSGNEGWYYEPTTGKAAPFNCVTAMGRTALTMWLATGQTAYLKRATMIANYFKRHLVNVSGAYVWSYAEWGLSEDMSHAAISVDFALQAYRAGVVFTADDMAAFAATFKKCTVTDAEGKVLGWYRYIEGKGAVDYNYVADWSRLGYVDDQVTRYLHGYTPAPVNWRVYAGSFLAEASGQFYFNLPVAVVPEL